MSSATRWPRVYRLYTAGSRLRWISICVVMQCCATISLFSSSGFPVLIAQTSIYFAFFPIFTELYCKSKRDSVQKSWTETDGAPAYVQLLSHYVISPTASRALLGLLWWGRHTFQKDPNDRERERGGRKNEDALASSLT